MIDDKIASLITQATPDELKKIRIFKSRTEKLLSNSLIQDGFNWSIGLQIDQKGPSFSFQLPSDEAVDSLLMRFRHFWLQDEPCNLFVILNIINRYIPDARNHTKPLKESWKMGMLHSTNIIIDDVPLTTEKLIDIWLNAEFFHNDQTEKKTELDNLIDKIDFYSPGFAKFLLVGSVRECCNVIFEVNKLLTKVQ
ncbi:hypothetical protein JCM14076_26350 [Methylosoma difficile]